MICFEAQAIRHQWCLGIHKRHRIHWGRSFCMTELLR